MKSCPGHISETVKCGKLILGRDIVGGGGGGGGGGEEGGGCKCAASWCRLDLTFDIAIVTLTFEILSELYLGNCNV